MPSQTNISASINFVIAHYNEDLSWIDPIVEYCTIYSKASPNKRPQYPHNTLPNIGREGHTFLHHIVQHYNSLPDVTVFLQGHIDDYITLTAKQIKERSLSTLPGQVTTFPFRELELFDCWDGIPWEQYPCWKKWSAMDCKPFPLAPGEMFMEYLGYDEVPLSIGFQPGAAFAVHRETIRRHPLSFYERLLHDFFEGQMAHVNPETGHYMERFWLAIFRPEEYICWDEEDVSEKLRNGQGQLAKGRWHRTPRGVRVDKQLIKMEERSRRLQASDSKWSGDARETATLTIGKSEDSLQVAKTIYIKTSSATNR